MNFKKMAVGIGLAFVVICLWLGFAPEGVNPSKPTSQQDNNAINQGPSKASVSNSFNTSDKTVISNNNMIVAATKLNDESSDSLFAKAKHVTASALTKNTYSSIGNVYKITGQVYKVEELSPSTGLKGKWGEILILSNNPNSPLGTTTIDYIFEGDISKINAGQVVTCAGYFIGTHDSQNAMGGTVESLVLVGNKFVKGKIK